MPVTYFFCCLLCLISLSSFADNQSVNQAPVGNSSVNSSTDKISKQARSSDKLESVIIISRHGVRSPIKVSPNMRNWATSPWPDWPVPYGDLTNKGAKLMTQLGGFYRDRLISPLGLDSACPQAPQIYAWADVDKRTRLSATALLKGMFPGCKIPVHHLADLKAVDPVFRPVQAGQCRYDDATARKTVKHEAGGSMSALENRNAYGQNLVEMGRVLNLTNSPACGSNRIGCSLASLAPSKLETNPDHRLAISGAIGESSSMAEIFLLEQAQGINAGWGRIKTQEQWQQLLALHNLKFDLLYGTPYLAKFYATPLMQIVDRAITGKHLFDKTDIANQGKPPLNKAKSNSPDQILNQQFPDIAENNKLLLLVGHDSNLASLAGALGWQWQLNEQPDNTPPGAALVLEKWKSGQGGVYVRVSLVYQTLTQMHKGDGDTPLHVTLGEYPLNEFTARLQQAQQPQCLLAR
ncbi:MAG: histidine-type phosphatase [Shewanella sp.]|nr:histidine-type phosphatase [Shewanella sp.]MCF1430889.1 histidine-type phosphatase [Shewanella sp.]MCF1438883.1 histidine-type phosphatase [Shewanella sp.]MCF1459206.1 histidine-type phosphatase [Shewanella sp.]